MPPHIILDKMDTHSLNGFTDYVKLFLLQTYQGTCTVPNCYIMFILEYYKHINNLWRKRVWIILFVTTGMLYFFS